MVYVAYGRDKSFARHCCRAYFEGTGIRESCQSLILTHPVRIQNTTSLLTFALLNVLIVNPAPADYTEPPPWGQAGLCGAG